MLLQLLSVNGPRSWWDYNYVGLHLFMTIERVKDVKCKYDDENSLSLHQSLGVNRPYLQSVLTIANLAFAFAMAQCEQAKILVGLQLCWPRFVYDYSEDENSLSLHQSLSVNRPYLQSVLTIANLAFTFAMAQCEWVKILLGLQLCWPSFVYDY